MTLSPGLHDTTGTTLAESGVATAHLHLAKIHPESDDNNTARRESITYPNGRIVNLGYSAADDIEDLFSPVKSIAIDGEVGNKVEKRRGAGGVLDGAPAEPAGRGPQAGGPSQYTRVGLGRCVEIAYPQPEVRMSMVRPGGGSEGDSGDPYDGYDRFSRTQAIRWEKTADGSVLDGWQWGFNEASNRT